MENNQVITKKTLLWKALYELVIVIGIIALIAAVIIFFVGLSARDRSGFSIYEIFLFAAGLFVILLGSTVLIVLPIPLAGLIRLHVMEKKLQIKYTDEAEINGITKIPFKNARWFIAVDKTHIIAFRRDYISSVQSDSITCNRHGLTNVHITTKDGKTINVSGYRSDIDDFVSWIMKNS